jgi:L-cysteine desulfidase
MTLRKRPPVLTSPEIELWFTTVAKELAQTEAAGTADFDAAVPFLPLERQCSAVEQKLKSVEQDLLTTIHNVHELERHSARCHFVAAATEVRASGISATATQTDAGGAATSKQASRTFVSVAIGYIHNISNWIFAFFE